MVEKNNFLKKKISKEYGKQRVRAHGQNPFSLFQKWFALPGNNLSITEQYDSNRTEYDRKSPLIPSSHLISILMSYLVLTHEGASESIIGKHIYQKTNRVLGSIKERYKTSKPGLVLCPSGALRWCNTPLKLSSDPASNSIGRKFLALLLPPASRSKLSPWGTNSSAGA